MSSKAVFRLLALCFVLIMAMPGQVAWSQEESEGEEAEEDVFEGLEEIVVTAERREQSVQDIAQAITALSAEDLDRSNIEDIHDLQYQVPSLQVTGGLPQPTLRGIGQDITAPSTDPGFILHVNGTYVTQLAVALLGFHDMERVEVLPGPTAIDYGRATTGGSMNFIWNRARMDETSLTGDFQAGTLDAARIRAQFNYAISDELAGRFSVAQVWAPRPFETAAKYGTPIEDGQKFSANALGAGLALRHALHWTPSEDFTADMFLQYTYDDTPGGAVRVSQDWPEYGVGQSPLFGGPPDYAGATPNPKDPGKLVHSRRTDQNYETVWAQLILAWNLDNYVVTSTSNYQYWDFALDKDWDGSDVEAERLVLLSTDIGLSQELTFASDFEGPFNFLIGGNLQTSNAPDVELDVWDYQQNQAAANFMILDAFNVGGYATGPVANICGPSGTAACVFQPLPEDHATFALHATTKTRLLGLFTRVNYDYSDAFRITLGARYSSTERDWEDSSRFDVFVEPHDLDTSALAAGDVVFVPAAEGTVTFLKGIGLLDQDFELGDDQLALLTRVGPGSLNNAPVTPGGAPQTYGPCGGNFPYTNTLGPVPIPNDPLLGCPEDARVASQTLIREWESYDGLFRIEYRPSDEVLLYGYISTGQRHGGFNWLEARPFKPEKIVAYEVGAKTESRDRTWVFNSTAFLYNYKDKFVSTILGSVTTTQNIGDVRVYGFEFELHYRPNRNLRIDAALGYLDTEVLEDYFTEDNSNDWTGSNPTNYCPENPPGDRHGSGSVCGLELAAQELVNLKGNSLPKSPEWTLSLGVEYSIELASGATLTPRIDFSWRDDYNLGQYENPLDLQKAYTQTDLRLRYSNASGSYYVEAFVENVEDEDEIRTQLESRTGHRQFWIAEPRFFGMRIGWNIGR